MMEYHHLVTLADEQRLANLEQEMNMLRNLRMSASTRLPPISPQQDEAYRSGQAWATPRQEKPRGILWGGSPANTSSLTTAGSGVPDSARSEHNDIAAMHADILRVHKERMSQDAKHIEHLSKVLAEMSATQKSLLETLKQQTQAHTDLIKRHDEAVTNHAALLKTHQEVLARLAAGPPSAGLGPLGVPPPPAPLEVIFKKTMDAWWEAHAELLRTRIVDRDYINGRDDAAMADSMVKFISKGLKFARWEAKDSKRATNVVDKEHYMEVYAAKLGARTDVPKDNLWNIKCRAEKCIEVALKSAGPNPTLKALLQDLFDNKEALSWSQGAFGPVVYTSQFLGTYANAMLSDTLYNHPKQHWGGSYFSGPRPLECGIFYIDPLVEYPLHYHQELEAYFILAGETRFVWFHEDKLIAMDRKQGEWHFNYPNVPHAITSPHNTPHLSLWFREGGPGQEANNNKFGPKWIGCADGLHMIDEHDAAGVPNHIAKDDDKMLGSLGFGRGTVFLKDTHQFLRSLTPAQFEFLKNDPSGFNEIDSLLTPEKHDQLIKKAGK